MFLNMSDIKIRKLVINALVRQNYLYEDKIVILLISQYHWQTKTHTWRKHTNIRLLLLIIFKVHAYYLNPHHKKRLSHTRFSLFILSTNSLNYLTKRITISAIAKAKNKVEITIDQISLFLYFLSSLWVLNWIISIVKYAIMQMAKTEIK